MLARLFSTFFPSRGEGGCQGLKHANLFPKQSGLFGEEFDNSINPPCADLQQPFCSLDLSRGCLVVCY